MIVDLLHDFEMLWRSEQPRQEGKAVRFGAFYCLGMKAVIVAGSARKVSQRWGRVLSVTPACQRRDCLVIKVSWTDGRRFSVTVRTVEVAELSQKGSDFEIVGVSLEALTGMHR